jgi:hypothetical protein
MSLGRLLGPQVDTIWKFPVPIETEFCLELPVGSVPLSVQWQNVGETKSAVGFLGLPPLPGQPMLWVAVDSQSHRTERHRFFCRGTGQPLPNLLHYRFIGTFQIEALGLVYHLFDGGPEAERT